MAQKRKQPRNGGGGPSKRPPDKGPRSGGGPQSGGGPKGPSGSRPPGGGSKPPGSRSGDPRPQDKVPRVGRSYDNPSSVQPEQVKMYEVFTGVTLEQDRERPGGYLFYIGSGAKRTPVRVPLRFDGYKTRKQLASEKVDVAIGRIKGGDIEGILYEKDASGAAAGDWKTFWDSSTPESVDRIRKRSVQFTPGTEVSNVQATLQQDQDEFDPRYDTAAAAKPAVSEVMLAVGGKAPDGSDRDIPNSQDGRGMLVRNFFKWRPPVNADGKAELSVVVSTADQSALAYEAIILWQRDLTVSTLAAAAQLKAYTPIFKALKQQYRAMGNSVKSAVYQRRFEEAVAELFETGKRVMQRFSDVMNVVEEVSNPSASHDQVTLESRTTHVAGLLQSDVHTLLQQADQISVFLQGGKRLECKPYLERDAEYNTPHISALQDLGEVLELVPLFSDANVTEDDQDYLGLALQEPLTWIGGASVANAARGTELYADALQSGPDPVLRLRPATFAPLTSGLQTPEPHVLQGNEGRNPVDPSDDIVDLFSYTAAGTRYISFDTIRSRTKREQLRERIEAELRNPDATEDDLDALFAEFEKHGRYVVAQDYFDQMVSGQLDYGLEVVERSHTQDENELLLRLESMPLEDVIRFLDVNGSKIGKYSFAQMRDVKFDELRRQVLRIVGDRVLRYVALLDKRVRVRSNRSQPTDDGLHAFIISVSVTDDGTTREIAHPIELTGDPAVDAPTVRALRERVSKELGVTAAPAPLETMPIEAEIVDYYNLRVGQKGPILKTDVLESRLGESLPAGVSRFEVVRGVLDMFALQIGSAQFAIGIDVYRNLQELGAIKITEGPIDLDDGPEDAVVQQLEDFCYNNSIVPPLRMGEQMFFRGTAIADKLYPDRALVVGGVVGEDDDQKLRVWYALAFDRTGRNPSATVSIDGRAVDSELYFTPMQVRTLLANGPDEPRRFERTNNPKWFATELEKGHRVSGQQLAEAIGLPMHLVRDGELRYRFYLDSPARQGTVRIISFDDAAGSAESPGQVRFAFEDEFGNMGEDQLLSYKALLGASERGMIGDVEQIEADTDVNELLDELRARLKGEPLELISKLNSRGSEVISFHDPARVKVYVHTISLETGLVTFSLWNDYAYRSYTISAFLKALRAPVSAGPDKETSVARGRRRYPVENMPARVQPRRHSLEPAWSLPSAADTPVSPLAPVPPPPPRRARVVDPGARTDPFFTPPAAPPPHMATTDPFGRAPIAPPAPLRAPRGPVETSVPGERTPFAPPPELPPLPEINLPSRGRLSEEVEWWLDYGKGRGQFEDGVDALPEGLLGRGTRKAQKERLKSMWDRIADIDKRLNNLYRQFFVLRERSRITSRDDEFYQVVQEEIEVAEALNTIVRVELLWEKDLRLTLDGFEGQVTRLNELYARLVNIILAVTGGVPSGYDASGPGPISPSGGPGSPSSVPGSISPSAERRTPESVPSLGGRSSGFSAFSEPGSGSDTDFAGESEAGALSRMPQSLEDWVTLDPSLTTMKDEVLAFTGSDTVDEALLYRLLLGYSGSAARRISRFSIIRDPDHPDRGDYLVVLHLENGDTYSFDLRTLLSKIIFGEEFRRIDYRQPTEVLKKEFTDDWIAHLSTVDLRALRRLQKKGFSLTPPHGVALSDGSQFHLSPHFRGFMKYGRTRAELEGSGFRTMSLWGLERDIEDGDIILTGDAGSPPRVETPPPVRPPAGPDPSLVPPPRRRGVVSPPAPPPSPPARPAAPPPRPADAAAGRRELESIPIGRGINDLVKGLTKGKMASIAASVLWNMKKVVKEKYGERFNTEVRGIVPELREKHRRLEAARARYELSNNKDPELRRRYVDVVKREQRLVKEVEELLENISQYVKTTAMAAEFLDDILPSLLQRADAIVDDYVAIEREL